MVKQCMYVCSFSVFVCVTYHSASLECLEFLWSLWSLYIIGASLSEPHIDDINARNPYIMFIIILYVWYVRHARTAIDIVQRCAVYFKRPHENICVSIVTCFFDTLNYFSEFRHFFWPLYYDYTYSLLQF